MLDSDRSEYIHVRGGVRVARRHCLSSEYLRWFSLCVSRCRLYSLYGTAYTRACQATLFRDATLFRETVEYMWDHHRLGYVGVGLRMCTQPEQIQQSVPHHTLRLNHAKHAARSTVGKLSSTHTHAHARTHARTHACKHAHTHTGKARTRTHT